MKSTLALRSLLLGSALLAATNFAQATDYTWTPAA